MDTQETKLRRLAKALRDRNPRLVPTGLLQNGERVAVDTMDLVALEVDRLIAEPVEPAPSSSPVQQPDARLSGVDGDETLRRWLRSGHNPFGDPFECVLAELVRRELARRPPATDATGEQP